MTRDRFWLSSTGVGRLALRRLAAFGVVVAAAVSLMLALGVSEANATVVAGAAPTYPIPANAPVGPPPIPLATLDTLPAAGATPSADQIADPVGASATCGGWQLQTNYGNRWPAGSSWWEYQCAAEQSSFYSSYNCTTGACNANCGYCYWETRDSTDYFYWDGTEPVFYGEAYSDSIDDDGGDSYTSTAWWDAPTAQWYSLGPFTLDVSTVGTGSGNVDSSPAGITCGGYACQANFEAGTVVTLTATPAPGSVFAGWSGDCSGTGICQVTMSQARSVTATFAPNTVDLNVSKAGSGSGSVALSPGGISCGAGCQASFGPGTVVTLTATPGAGSVFAGWSGDCSGNGSCVLTMDQARSVTATFAPDLPPHASFTLTCTSLACKFDASASSDTDDGIASYAWNFGDGTTATGPANAAWPISHTYAKAGSYTVTLTVTDNAGATATTSKTFNPISVSARGYKRNGAQKVDLAWNGASGTSFDVYRNGTNIGSLKALSYTDTVIGQGTFTYKVCASATSVCSNEPTVSF